MKNTGTLKLTTRGDREIVMTRVFDAPRSLVFEAFSKPELVRQWLLGPPGWSMPVCEIDFRVGGRYRYVWAHPTQPGFEFAGTFREIKAPERIVHSEEYQGMEALITSLFTEKAGRTTLTLTMLFPSREARDAAI